MITENTIVVSKKVHSRIAQFLIFFSAFIVTSLIVIHFIWKYSGSSKWELALDKNGVKVYSMKTPGSVQQQFKGVTQIHTTLNRIAAEMLDTSTAACREFVSSCIDEGRVEAWNPQTLSFVEHYRVNFRRPFSPRDLILETQFSRNSQSKSMLVQFTALPDKLPRSTCCVRVTDLHNSWHFTPTENNQIKVEYLGNYDATIPYFIFNRGAPFAVVQLLNHMERMFNRDKYKDAEFAFLSK